MSSSGRRICGAFLGFTLLSALNVFLFAYNKAFTPVSIAAQGLLFGGCAVLMTARAMTRRRLTGRRSRIEGKVFFIRATQAELEGIRSSLKESPFTAELNALIEAVRFSDPMSCDSPEMKRIEEWIATDVEALKSDVEALCDEASADVKQVGERIANILRLLQERNVKCGLNKNQR